MSKTTARILETRRSIGRTMFLSLAQTVNLGTGASVQHLGQRAAVRKSEGLSMAPLLASSCVKTGLICIRLGDPMVHNGFLGDQAAVSANQAGGISPAALLI